MVFWNLGTIKNCDIYFVKSGMGSIGISGSHLTVHESIRLLNTDYIIMAGIAFGLKERKQNLTEILVSQLLQNYELARVTDESYSPRAAKVPPGLSLYNKIENAEFIWEGIKVHFGFIISGEKLCDSKILVERLIKIFPEAIGGEMEGTGLQAASDRAKKDWILIKGICDWGYEKDDDYQEKAMENVVDFLIHTFKEISF